MAPILQLRRLGRVASVVLIVSIMASALASCRLTGSADSGSSASINPEVEIDLPTHPDADLVASDHLPEDQLPYEASDGVAAIYEVDERGMTVSSFYSMEVAGDEWEFRGGGATEFIQTFILSDETRVAKVVLVPGGARDRAPDQVEKVDVAPFDLDAFSIDRGETLIYVGIAVCEETSTSDCLLAVQEEVNEVTAPER